MKIKQQTAIEHFLMQEFEEQKASEIFENKRCSFRMP